jgi:hypothetical protein
MPTTDPRPGCWCCTCAHAADRETGCAASMRSPVQAWINEWSDTRSERHGVDVYSHPPAALQRCPGHERPDAVAEQLDLLAAP